MPTRRALMTLLMAGLCGAGGVPALAQDAGEAARTGDPGLTPDVIRSVTEQFRVHGVAEAPPKPDGSVRIATYNIHDLYDDADDPELTGRRDDASRTMTPARRLATGLALRDLDADIVALQEVESFDALQWYNRDVLEEMGYTYAASEDVGHSLGMEQAVLSRFPILATKTWPDRVIGAHPELYRGRPNRYAGEPLTFRRSPLMVEIGLVDKADEGKLGVIPESQRLTLLVVHAKTGDGSEAWRAAEGAALAAIVGELTRDRPERRVVVLGDFAVPADAGHLAPLLGSGFRDAFAGVIAGEHDPKTIATDFGGERTSFVLLGSGASIAPESTPFVLGTLTPPKQFERQLVYSMPGFASDHYPVAVDLER